MKSHNKKLPSQLQEELEIEEELLEEEGAQKKSKKKSAPQNPLPVYIVLGITILFTSTFALLKNINHLSASFIRPIQLPTVSSVPLAQTDNLDTQLDKIFGDFSAFWTIGASTISGKNSPSSWSYHSKPVDPSSDQIQKLSQKKPDPNFYFASAFPQGATIQGSVFESPTKYRLDILVTVPEKQIYINLENSDPQKNKFSPDKILPVLSEIYWHQIGD